MLGKIESEINPAAIPATSFSEMSTQQFSDAYEQQQASLLYKNAGLALFATISASSLVAYYFYGYTDKTVLMSWYTILFIVSALRSVVARAYQIKLFNRSAHFWVRAFEAGTALSGIVWGSAALFIIPPDSFTHHVMLAFVLGGLCAGTVAIYTVSRYASSSFAIFTLLPLIYSLHIIDKELALPMEVLSVIYLFAMLVVMRRIYSAMHSSIILDMRNKVLVSYLSDSLTEMDELNAQLHDEVNNRRLAEEELSCKKELAEVTLSSLGDGVITTNSRGAIDYMNPSAELLTNYDHEAVFDKPIEDVLVLLNNGTGEAYQNITTKVIDNQTDELSGSNTVLVRNNGEQLPIVFTCSPMRNNEKEIIGSVIVFRDISELRRLENKLSYEASHDSLTGLINRSEFEFRLKRLAESAQKSSKQYVLMYLDLDQFKVVNDTCGHVAGDELLKQIANYIPVYLRESDSVARLGGDEFGILLENCPIEKAKHIAETLRVAINKLSFVWDNKTFETSVSIGVAPITSSSGDLAELMRSVDSACYIAKDMGRNRIHVISEDDTAVAERDGELQWVHRIKNAMQEDRIVLFVQRILPLKSNYNELHYEVLMRMKDENGELLPPMAYIPAAERYDLMPSLDRHVVNKAFGYITKFLNKNSDATIFSINLSGHSFCDEDFLDSLVSELLKSGIPPETICFEVTETAAIGNLKEAQRFMSVLRNMGCQFSLDDFGSGLSSFAYLKNLDVNYLKIDGCFVRDIETDPVDEAMVKSINQVGQVLGMKTIAEFVENDVVVGMLKNIGVDYVQGYGIEKPHPFDDLLNE